MPRVTLEFIGLHLFSTADDPLKIAVINASRPGVVYRGVPLDIHAASIEIAFDPPSNDDQLSVDWPLELTGCITFKSDQEPKMSRDNWKVPRLHAGSCTQFSLDPLYFTGYGGKRHAIIELRTGEFSSCETKNGAIITRVAIDYTDEFLMCRKVGIVEKTVRIKGKNATIRFCNTEVGPSMNDLDWLWYYEATGNSCVHGPVKPKDVKACPGDITTLTLGCSNSGWP